MIVALWAQLPPTWYRIIEIAWSVLTIIGMGLRIWANWSVLQDAERKQCASAGLASANDHAIWSARSC
jgi:hypothetical protein